jgi:uncharacterized protein with GYD domain
VVTESALTSGRSRIPSTATTKRLCPRATNGRRELDRPQAPDGVGPHPARALPDADADERPRLEARRADEHGLGARPRGGDVAGVQRLELGAARRARDAAGERHGEHGQGGAQAATVIRYNRRMPTFILLSTLTPDGVQTVKNNPQRIREVNREIEQLGATVKAQWATLGHFDFVNIVEAPDEVTMARVSLELGSRGTAHYESMTAIPIDDFIASL